MRIKLDVTTDAIPRHFVTDDGALMVRSVDSGDSSLIFVDVETGFVLKLDGQMNIRELRPVLGGCFEMEVGDKRLSVGGLECGDWMVHCVDERGGLVVMTEMPSTGESILVRVEDGVFRKIGAGCSKLLDGMRLVTSGTVSLCFDKEVDDEI